MDPGRIELPFAQCECAVLPLNYRPSGITKSGRGTRRLSSAIALTPLLRNPRFLTFSPSAKACFPTRENRRVLPTRLRCGLLVVILNYIKRFFSSFKELIFLNGAFSILFFLSINITSIPSF